MKSTRKTIPKTAILELITNSDVALSQIEIQKILNGLCDRVTIYRVLDRLVNEDLIHKIATQDGTLKYAGCKHTHKDKLHFHNHIHFNCEKCNSVTCLDGIEPIFKIPNEYYIKEINFTITGFCPTCL